MERSNKRYLEERIDKLIQNAVEGSGTNLIAQLVEDSVSKELRIYKVAFWSFFAGFLLFITIGLLTKGDLFKTIIKSIYPPKDIYSDISSEFISDESFKSDFVQKTDYSKLKIHTADFSTFPKIETALADEVWGAVIKGDRKQYLELVSQPEFFDALKEHHSDLSQEFLVPSNNKLKLAAKIEELKGIPFDVRILMAGEDAGSKPTSKCLKHFNNKDLHAELVIPKSMSEDEFAWANCSFGWPDIFLKVQTAFSSHKVGVKLVGSRRNGNANEPVILISQKLAKELDIAGHDNYTGNTTGTISIYKAIP